MIGPAAWASVLLAASGWAQEVTPPKTPPAPWQIAGIRAAFGDARVPIQEASAAVQREALKLCAEKGWGAALAPQALRRRCHPSRRR